MGATLFAVPASHPSLAAELMLRSKGVAYRRVDLVAVVHRGVLRALRFPGITVPALKLDGARVLGALDLAALDEAVHGAADGGDGEPERLGQRPDGDRLAGLVEDPQALDLGEGDPGLLDRGEDLAVGRAEHVLHEHGEIGRHRLGRGVDARSS